MAGRTTLNMARSHKPNELAVRPEVDMRTDNILQRNAGDGRGIVRLMANLY